MKRLMRYAAAATALAVLALAIIGWAVIEARRQRSSMEATFLGEAALLARSLAPGLSAASDAAREIDDAVSWRLLDNARLLAEISGTRAGGSERLDELAESSGLDSVATIDRSGRMALLAGVAIPPQVRAEVEAFLDGDGEELILGSSLGSGARSVAAAVRTGDGGALVVSARGETSRAFVRRLGVENLLRSVVESGGVLYVEYREEPDGVRASATWDGAELPAAADRETGLRDVRGQLAFEAIVPVSAPAGLTGSLRVGFDGSPLRVASADAARRTLLVALVLAGLVLALVGVVIVSRLRSGERAEAAARLEALEHARRRSERLAAAGALTAGLAHEVRSPLNAIALAAQRLERGLPCGSDGHKLASRVRGEVARLDGVLREFLELARPNASERVDVELSRLARDVIDLLDDEARARGVLLGPVRGSGGVCADAGALRRALINILRNAIQASDAGGRIEIEAGIDGEAAFVRVLDEGAGLAPEDTERVLEPFVTTRAGGTGLGLAIVRRIADDHSGTFTLRNRPRRGVEAVLRIPVPGARY